MKHPSHIANQHNNHPRLGSSTATDPIYTIEDVEKVKKLLRNRPRDYLFFIMGINNGLRAGDLLQLRAESFKNAKIGDIIRLKEQKRGKIREVMVNEAVKEALDRYFAAYNGTNEYLFQSRKCQNQPITVSRANILVKSWCKQAGLRGNYGSHTLRKTYGTIRRKYYGQSWEVICKGYNHSDPKVTMRYLGVQDDEVRDMVMGCPI
jgi:integrase